MMTFLSGFKAKCRLWNTARCRSRIIMGLDSMTAIRLQSMIDSDPRETESILSILKYSLSWKRRFIRNNLKIYSTHRDAVHEVIRSSVNSAKEDRVAGQVFIWVNYHFPDKGIDFHAQAIEIASRLENTSSYMGLTFRDMKELGLTEALELLPDSKEQIIDAINRLPRGHFRYHHSDEILIEMANAPEHLQAA